MYPTLDFDRLTEAAQLAVRVADQCPVQYQKSCFEVVLAFLLNRVQVTQVQSGPTRESSALPAFLTRNGVDSTTLERVLDIAGGGVLVKSVGKSKAEIVRNLAVLMAVIEAAKGGEPVTRKDALVGEAKRWSAYDSSNFARYIKDATHDGKRIFTVLESGDIRLSRPGEDYAAELIKKLAGGSADG